MKLPKKMFSCRLAVDTINKIKALAESTHDSDSGVIEKAIAEYYKNNKEN